VNSCIYVTCFCICSEASFAILIFEFKDERIRVSIYDRLIKAHNQYGILVETDVRSSFQNSRALEFWNELLTSVSTKIPYWLCAFIRRS